MPSISRLHQPVSSLHAWSAIALVLLGTITGITLVANRSGEFEKTKAAGATITAASCNQVDVQNAVNLAQNGDVVQVPAGTCAWTSYITLNGVTLRGSGSGRIISYSEPFQTVGTGIKTFTLGSSDGGATWSGAGLAIAVGQTLRVSMLGTRGTFMEGTVTSYSGSTLVMNITNTGGSGTHHQWIVSTIPTTVITNNLPSDQWQTAMI